VSETAKRQVQGLGLAFAAAMFIAVLVDGVVILFCLNMGMGRDPASQTTALVAIPSHVIGICYLCVRRWGRLTDGDLWFVSIGGLLLWLLGAIPLVVFLVWMLKIPV